jgi:predicted NUDIX family phosphoesterase
LHLQTILSIISTEDKLSGSLFDRREISRNPAACQTRKGRIVQDEKYLEEHVLVFPSSLLDQIGLFQGLSFEPEKFADITSNPKNHIYIKRKEAEINPTYKQLIPYAILHCNGKIFVYRRGKLLAEKRLFDYYSIGVGGHISISDPGLFGTTYEDGLKREIHEEVFLESAYTQRIAAVLNDDSNEVGKVHFGIVHVLELEKAAVKPRERSINETKFVSPGELQKDIDRFESWSRICIRHIQQLID